MPPIDGTRKGIVADNLKLQTAVFCGVSGWFGKVWDVLGRASGGRGGIRTHGTLSRTAVFKTAAFNRSATRPYQRLLKSMPHYTGAGAATSASISAAVMPSDIAAARMSDQVVSSTSIPLCSRVAA